MPAPPGPPVPPNTMLLADAVLGFASRVCAWRAAAAVLARCGAMPAPESLTAPSEPPPPSPPPAPPTLPPVPPSVSPSFGRPAHRGGATACACAHCGNWHRATTPGRRPAPHAAVPRHDPLHTHGSCLRGTGTALLSCGPDGWPARVFAPCRSRSARCSAAAPPHLGLFLQLRHQCRNAVLLQGQLHRLHGATACRRASLARLHTRQPPRPSAAAARGVAL